MIDRFRRWTLARRTRFFGVVGAYTIVLAAGSAAGGLDPRVLGGIAFCGALFAVVFNLRHGSMWDDR